MAGDSIKNLKPLSIYVHIPYCEKKCNYCSFVSSENKNTESDYFTALKNEILGFDYSNFFVSSVFFGGGTPSFVNEMFIVETLKLLQENFIFDLNVEITIECNPNSATLKKLQCYFDAGFNRLSFGVQSFNDNVLKILGRIHSSKEAINCVNIAHNMGFRNISIDLLCGVPSQTENDILKDIEIIKSLPLSHISVYSLIVENQTEIKKMVDSGDINLPNEDSQILYFRKYCEGLTKNLFNKYEVSNFAKKNFESNHNIAYWIGQDYVGFGVAAHSYINGVRKSNTANIDTYIFGDKVESVQILTQNEKREEFIMLGLRMTKGLDLQKFKMLFNEDLVSEKKVIIDKMISNNFINIRNDYLFATEKGFNLLNQIILYLV